MNKFTNTRIEFHILQSFPVSCLNRDDVGAPKSAVIGGVERARVSSQCWKRAVRLELHRLGVRIADRTKLVAGKIAEQCVRLGSDPEAAEKCSLAVAGLLAKSVKNGESDTLFFISNAEAASIAEACRRADGTFAAPGEKEVKKLFKEHVNTAADGLDIALFGRMVAQAPELNIEAAASFAHAISTHRASSEIDFFTAVDDLKNHDGEEDRGAGHMGSLEFNSATYYRYVSLDLGQLAENLHTEAIEDAVDVFAKALFLAQPAARQATMAAMCPWNYAIVTIRNGQGIQMPFNKPVKPAAGEDMVSASIRELKTRFGEIARMYGSLFGLQSKQEIGTDSGDIDSLLTAIRDSLKTL